MPTNPIFQNRIQELVKENGSPKIELAKQIGIAHCTFSRAVNYGIIPKTKILIRFADFFEVSVDYLLGKTDSITFYPTSNPSTFYDRIEKLTQDKGFKSLSALAQTAHLPRQYLFDWKKKNILPTAELLEYLADYFDVSIDFLLGRSDE